MFHVEHRPGDNGRRLSRARRPSVRRSAPDRPSTPNSTTIRPLRCPISTRTRVSKVWDRRSASSCVTGSAAGFRRGGRGVVGSSLRASSTDSSVARTDSPSATIRVARSSCCPGSSRPEERAGVPGREHAGRHPPLHGHRQLEQPDGVRDHRTAAAEPVGQFGVRHAELDQQLLVGRSLLQRIELDAVDVLQQRVAQEDVVAGPPDDRGDPAQPGALRRAPAPLAHDELVAPVARSRGPRRAAAARTHGSSVRVRPAPPRRRRSAAAAGSARSR